MKKIDQAPPRVSGTRVTFGQPAKAEDTAAPTNASVAELAVQREARALSGLLPAGTHMVVDFGTSPVGADASAKLFSKLLRSDASDIVALTQYLAALGVQIGYQGTPLGHFTGITHRLANVPFPAEPSAALLPAFMKISELSASTKAMAIALQKDQSPQNLRKYKTEAVFVAHALAEIWKLAPTHDPSGALGKASLQALKNVAELQGRIQFAMQDFVEGTKRDMGLPVEGGQPLLDPKDGELIFRNSLRLGRVELDPQIRQEELDKKYQKSLKKGAKASDIEEMTTSFVKKTPHGARFEYVLVVEKDKGGKRQESLRVTLNEVAGHSMLAGIDPRAQTTVADQDRKLDDNYGLVAGGGRLIRATDGTEIVLVDPKSGHYRAPTQLAEGLAPYLVASGVRAENIIVTPGDPLDTGEVLAIDVWLYKRDNNNQLPKDVGDKFFDDSVKLFEEAKAHGLSVAQGVLS